MRTLHNSAEYDSADWTAELIPYQPISPADPDTLLRPNPPFSATSPTSEPRLARRRR